MKAEVIVMLKEGVLDTQGKAVKDALAHMGQEGISKVRIGRFIEVELDEHDSEQAKKCVEKMCTALLANPVIEDYQIKIV